MADAGVLNAELWKKLTSGDSLVVASVDVQADRYCVDVRRYLRERELYPEDPGLDDLETLTHIMEVNEHENSGSE